MNLDKELKAYKKKMDVKPKEENILETIEASKEIFLASEQTLMLTHCEFVWMQFRLIQKKWWVLQSFILVALLMYVSYVGDYYYICRSMGVGASLFVILLIPELWKNRTYHAMEIEASTYYSLHQIYSARMLLFGIVDVVFVSIFCAVATISLRFELIDLMIQFLFPMAVTACICFGVLCSKRFLYQSVGIVLCMAWSVLWWFVLLDEKIYKLITVPVWIALFTVAIVFMAYAINKSINCCNKIWEVNFNEVGNE